jgi:hypothetical protein
MSEYFRIDFQMGWERGYLKGDFIVYHSVSAASLPPFGLIPALTFIKISPVLSSTLTGYDV